MRQKVRRWVVGAADVAGEGHRLPPEQLASPSKRKMPLRSSRQMATKKPSRTGVGSRGTRESEMNTGKSWFHFRRPAYINPAMDCSKGSFAHSESQASV